MAEKSKIPDWDALEKQGKADSEAAREATLAQREAPLAAAGAEGAAGAAGLGFIDKMSLGLLPALHDKLVDWAGEERMGKKYSELIPQAEAAHPIASTVGGGAGMVLPIGGALRLAQGLKAIPAIGGAVQGAAAVGGENIADQAVRTQTEDRPFNPLEAGGAAVMGAVNPLTLASGAFKLAAPSARKVLGPVLGPIWDMARKSVPTAAKDAAKTLGGQLDDAAAGAAPKPAAPPVTPRPAAPPVPPPENLAAYAPDDALGEIAKMAREQARLRKIADPNWAPNPGPLEPPKILKAPPQAAPVAPPEGLLAKVTRIGDVLGDTWTAGSRGTIESGLRVGSEDKKRNLRRRRPAA